MATNPNWPTVDVQVEFVAGTWTSLPTRVSKISSTRGRQYELATVQAGVLNVTFENFDGALDPTNTASPYYPNVKLMKRIRVMATWTPNAGELPYPSPTTYPGANLVPGGPTTYPIFTGYVERWPQRWGPAGNGQWTDLVATDLIGPLSGQVLDPSFYEEVRRYAYYGTGTLLAWYPLDDKGGTAVGSEVGAPAGALEFDGLTTATLGSSQSTAPGNKGANVLTCSGPTTNAVANNYVGDTTVAVLPPVAAPPSLAPWTVMIGFNATHGQNASAVILYMSNAVQDQFIGFAIYAGMVFMDYGYNRIGTTNVGTTSVLGKQVDDGRDHLFAISLAADLRTVTVSLDGVVQTGLTYVFPPAAASATLGPLKLTNVSVGGANYSGVSHNEDPFGGTLAHYLCFSGDLIASGDVASVFSPYYLGGHYNDLTSVRFFSAAAASPLGFSLTTTADGNSHMQVADWGGKSVAQAMLDAAIAENGFAFVSAGGVFTFVNRQWRYNPTPAYVFGDGPGELHYTDVTVDYDLTHVANRVRTVQPGGVTVTANGVTSQAAYGVRDLQQTLDVVDPRQVTDAANYLLNVYAEPVSRVPQLVLKPAADPTLWPAALGGDLNKPVSIARRPAAGVSSTRTCWVEQVATSIDFGAGTFTTTWQLSPADVNKYLVLDSTTLGTVDTVNRLAY